MPNGYVIYPRLMPDRARTGDYFAPHRPRMADYEQTVQYRRCTFYRRVSKETYLRSLQRTAQSNPGSQAL